MATQDDYIRTALRVPPDLHAQIHNAAKGNNRTFNAEIVARLQDSFSGRLNPALPSLAMSAGDLPFDVNKLLQSMPADLSSQYALHLYRSEQKIAEAQLEEAREKYQRLYSKLQRVLAKADASPGEKARAKEAVSEVNGRIWELENQLVVLGQTIRAIHFYRKTHDLPEIRNVREISVSVTIGGRSSSQSSEDSDSKKKP